MGAETVAIIPARYRSTRLPGKALALIGDRPMICHVAERTRRARDLGDVLVATDDERIREAVAAAGGKVVMTRDDHPSGTDRLAEVAAALSADVLVNVQGDLPLLDPAMVDMLVARMSAEPGVPMATLATPLRDEPEFRSPHVVKVVTGRDGRALYFSRSPIPADRDGTRTSEAPFGWRHVGMYAYRRDVLLRLAGLRPTPLEERERLEQLRALEHGIAIGVVEWHAAEPLIEVDTPEDLERARTAWEAINRNDARKRGREAAPAADARGYSGGSRSEPPSKTGAS
jgi:3-deoxy-manno-octulosonate cytidylyltransferase (CMP-KDO synthetase)